MRGLDEKITSRAGLYQLFRAEAFDDLLEVIEVLGDAGEGMGWMKRQQHQLRESKRYLKSDFKVCSTSRRSTMEKLRELNYST